MAGERLGKGLKSNELFKKTEENKPDEKCVNVQLHKCANAQMRNTGKESGVRKHVVLPSLLDERLRAFCFQKKTKEAQAVRQALELFLKSEGF